MTAQKNVTVEKPTKTSIEFDLNLTSEQHEAIELLAKLQEQTVQEFIYDQLKGVIAGHIEGHKEHAVLQQNWDETLTSFTASKTITLHCELESQGPEELEVISKLAKSYEETPSDLLESSFRSIVDSYVDQWPDLPAIQKVKGIMVERA